MALLTTLSTLEPITLTSKHDKLEIVRKSAKYHPSIWGDHFISYSQDQMKLDTWRRRVEELKNETRNMLWKTHGSQQEIHLIDDIQRLGLAYHFEEEIEVALQEMNNTFYPQILSDDHLQSVALKFRLLRQGGYYVPSDVFSKFTERPNEFKPCLRSNIMGLLSLYEAAFLSITGEDILDEATAFTREHLSSAVPHLQAHLATHVRQALDLPLHKGMPRLKSRHYITFYQQERTASNKLLEFAKLDFNVLQSIHQRELKEASLWWKTLDLPKKLPFARDRLVELYYWILTLYYEPHYSWTRVSTTKLICLASVTDDIYDIHGTLDELELLTDAIHRWDLGAMAALPEWMKVYYRALLDTVQDIEDQVAPDGFAYQIDYLKEAVKGFVGAYLQEAKWCKTGHVPKLEEHFTASLKTAGYPVLPVAAILGMGEMVTREALAWLLSGPKFMKASAMVARLMDDIVSHKFEQERDHVASTVECYMEDKGVSEEEACNQLRGMVANAWKELNEGLLRPFSYPLPVLLPTLSLARTAELFYRSEDAYTNAAGETKDNIISLFIEPMKIQV